MSRKYTPVDTEWIAYPGEELDALAGARNYYRWLCSQLRPYTGRRLLEIGAGIGTFAAALREHGMVDELVLAEPDRGHVQQLARRYGNDPSVRIMPGEFRTLPDGVAPVDSVALINVLEHIEDHEATLRAARAATKPGGTLLLYVPAMPMLMGQLDREFGHFRRYTKRSATEVARAAGFEPMVVRYANLPGAAAWFLIGRVGRAKTISGGMVSIYDRIVIPVVAAVERVVPPPFGQSLLLVGRAV